MPLRMHLMLRGDNISRVCAGCGNFVAEGIFACSSEGCEGRTYDLYFDRNCGGTYLLIWFEYRGTYSFSAGASNLSSPDHTQIRLTHAHQRRNFNERSRRDELLGLLVRVVDDDSIHALSWLEGWNCIKNDTNLDDRDEDEWIKIRDSTYGQRRES